MAEVAAIDVFLRPYQIRKDQFFDIDPSPRFDRSGEQVCGPLGDKPQVVLLGVFGTPSAHLDATAIAVHDGVVSFLRKFRGTLIKFRHDLFEKTR